MPIIEKQQHWAIEFPGKGILSNRHPALCDVVSPTGGKDGYESLGFAEQALAGLKTRYRDMGVPEAAELLRIVTRTVTMTYADYQPLDPSYEELERNSQ